MRSGDRPPSDAEHQTLFSHPDYTVGRGIAPRRRLAVRLQDVCGLLPPVWNCTTPQRLIIVNEENAKQAQPP